MEELAVVKERLSQAEDLQKETNKKYELLLERYHSDTQTFKAQEENVVLNVCIITIILHIAFMYS